MKKILRILNPLNWQKDSQRFFGTILAVFIVLSVLALFVPQRSSLETQVSDVMSERLSSDAQLGDGGQKSVTITYNNLYFINYLCYSTSGSAALNEAYIGFAGHVFDATAETYSFVAASDTVHTLKVTDANGNKKAVYTDADGDQITMQKENGVFVYYVNGNLIPVGDDETATYTSDNTTYNIARDKFGNIIASEKDGDQVKMTDGYIYVNGEKLVGSGKTPASVAGELINFTYRMLGCGQSVLYGAKLTIFLTATSVLAGVFFSVFLALGKISKIKPLKAFCSSYIFFFRGTPLMIQLFVIYFALPGVIPGFTWSGLFPGDLDATSKGAFLAAFIAFSLNSAAYCAEIVRAAIESIDKGQYEASRALGMNYAQTMGKVVIPQSIRRLIPPVANEFIMVLKDASLVFVISLQDITTISKNISSKGNFLVFIPALVIYLIITLFFTFIFNKLEKKFSIYE